MEPRYTLITDTAALVRCLDELRGIPVMAIDTEASSFHRYHEQICLIQLSDRERNYLLDPKTIEDMSPLGATLADPNVEWVIHDADFDLRMLKKMWGFHVANVFDTMVTAELLNEPELGLAALLRKYFDITLNKKFQKADWGKRPLPPDMLAYAAMDTAYLIRLRDELDRDLRAKGRRGWAEEEFKALVRIPFETPENTEPAYLRIKGAKALKPRQLAVLRELHAWRDPLAERLDRAPFMVLGNDTLIDLSKDPPSDLSDLARRKGLGESTLARNGEAILAAVQRGLDVPKEQWPRLPRPKRWERDDDYEERLKRLKNTRDRLSTEHGLRPGITAPNHVLADIARLLPGDREALGAIPGMRRWQVQEFGEDLLKAL
ncbi:MAG TPA: ribonuclease D [Flavobacteriales bacterium]